MSETCAACQQIIQDPVEPYGSLFICAACRALGFYTCDSPRVNAMCQDPTLGGPEPLPKLLAAGTHYFVPGYPRYNAGQETYRFCKQCDTSLQKVKCDGNCGNWIIINELKLKGITVADLLLDSDGAISGGFCTTCLNPASQMCGVCKITPVASKSDPYHDVFPGATAWIYNKEWLYRCKVCAPQVITNKVARGYYDVLGNILGEILPGYKPLFPPLRLVGETQLLEERSRRGTANQVTLKTALQGFWTDDPASVIYMPTARTKANFLSTAAHELTHPWQHSFPALENIDLKTKEGFAQWVAHVVLNDFQAQLGVKNKEVLEEIQEIEKSTYPNYGSGFRAFQALEVARGKKFVVQVAMHNPSIDACLKKEGVAIPDEEKI